MRLRSALASAGLALLLGSGVVLSAAPAQATGGHHHPRGIDLQEDFDVIGSEVHELTVDGRTSYYIDQGRASGRPVVFIGGQGTSLEAYQLSDFARTSRAALGLRMISVERNGFGESQLDLSLGYKDYNKEVLAVLDHLGVRKFGIVAISGGGAYAAQLAAAVPHRVISVHFAAASPMTLPNRPAPNCTRTLEERNEANIRWTHNPKDWWAVPGSPVLKIPGWQATAYLDAVRSFYLGGQLGDPSALSHEGMLPCSADAVADVSKIKAPTYLYYGGADTTVPPSVADLFKQALPNVVKSTVYPGEGHTVQYRHWEQIMADLAGYGKYTVVCTRGRTQLVPNRDADRLVARGATLGLCAWAR